MKNTPYIYLAHLHLILILTIGVVFGRNDEQEIIDIIEQEELHHEDSLNTNTVEQLELGPSRGVDISTVKGLIKDTLRSSKDQFRKKSQPSMQISKEEASDYAAIEVLEKDTEAAKSNEVSIYTQISDWLGRIFMILSGLLIVLGGVYLFGQRNKDRTPQPEEISSAAAESSQALDQEGQSIPPKSNAYERFMGNLKKDFAEGDIEKVIRQLLILTKGTNTHDIVSMLANQWEELETEHLAGRITEEFYLADIENISKTILELINGLEG